MKLNFLIVAPVLGIVTFTQSSAIAENLEHVNRALSTNQCLKCDLRGAGLVMGKLTGVDLTGSDLREANLSHANLSNSNLRNVDFRGASLQGANLSGSDLTGANLSGADLNSANFGSANLKGATFSGSDLRKSYFVGANLEGTTLDNTFLRGSVGVPVKAVKPEEYYAWAVEEDRKGNHKAAIEYFNKAVIVDPKYALAYMGRAISLKQLGETQNAIQDSERASQLFESQGDQKGLKISQDLTEAIKNPPNHSNNGGDFGNVIMGLGSLFMQFFLR